MTNLYSLRSYLLMQKTALPIDLGDHYIEARQFARDNPERTLDDLLRLYPARFAADQLPNDEIRRRPLAYLTLRPQQIPDGVTVSGRAPGVSGGLRQRLDALYAAEVARQTEPDSPPAPPLAPGSATSRTPTDFPEQLSEDEAVRIAYRQELEQIATYLRHGLSVLVVCDKVVTEYVYEYVCHRAGKEPVLESQQAENERAGLGGQLDRALQGDSSNPSNRLPPLLHNLKPNQVLVLRALELLDTPPLTEVVYQRSGSGDKPQLLAFLDPSLEVRKVLSDRFVVHVALIGLPRYTQVDAGRSDYTVSRLLTRSERERFVEYDPEGLYKNVAGLNAIQFRNAMRFVAAKLSPQQSEREIYQQILHFKKSSSEEIEIPDTTFEEIGGYEEVKRELKRIIALLAGPIAGMDERQRHALIPRGFIFHGPPGTGKTLFAKAIANEMNATIQMVSGPEIMDKYVGQSENNLRRIFATARRNAPAVVFFDEFDSLAAQRSNYADGGARANNAVVAQLLTELDGFRQEQTVLVIGTTNRIDIIDEALLRPSRLRPIEIGRPDTAARQRVAAIHAASFGVDRLLCDLCALALAHLPAWETSSPEASQRTIPAAFLDGLFAQHPAHRLRYETEGQQAGFLRDLAAFFSFVQATQQANASEANQRLLDQLRGRLLQIAERYGLEVKAEQLPDLESEAGRAWLLPIQSDLRDLFALLSSEQQQQRRLTPEAFLAATLDLIAEYSDGFNNDEIRAIFQESGLAHHMEGQLITPRYLGQKIGLIRKRRDEREVIHLSAGLRRR